MAIEQAQATPAPAGSDLMSLESCVLLLAETGEPASRNTIYRWVREHQMPTTRFGRRGAIYVSFSDVLEAHRDWVDGRQGLN